MIITVIYNRIGHLRSDPLPRGAYDMSTIRSVRLCTITGYVRTIIMIAALLDSLFIHPASSVAADFPQAGISNGLITASVYLPDAENGFYRSTRFDWSGAICRLRYEGHEFYGPWIDRTDSNIINWVFQGEEIVSGLCSANAGPVDEFVTPLGWDEAESGGAFIKIGVGILRKDGNAYNQYKHYDVLDSGTWSIHKETDSIEFTQELKDPSSGYAYLYRKTVRLVDGKPVLEIGHSLKNTGTLAIHSMVYNHNFVVLDEQEIGPDFSVRMPFRIRQGNGDNRGPAEIDGNRIIFPRPLAGEDEIVLFIDGFGDTPEDSEIIIENKKVGAGMRIAVDRPLIQELLWSIRSVLTIEPFVAIDIEPGGEFTWKNTIEYYTMPVND